MEILMKRQFCATVYIIEENKVLLIFHRKLQKWLPPGGHIDENETPPEAAKREVLEETGLEIEFLTQENVWINDSNAESFERPFMCLLEHIPHYKDEPSHQHMDFIYVARPLKGELIYNSNETEAIRWFTYEEIMQMELGTYMFAETLESIKKIIETFSYTQVT